MGKVRKLGTPDVGFQFQMTEEREDKAITTFTVNSMYASRTSQIPASTSTSVDRILSLSLYQTEKNSFFA